MSKYIFNRIKFSIALLTVLVVAAVTVIAANTPKTAAVTTVSSATPCVGAQAPSQWKHVVVIMYENKFHNQVINAKDSSGNLLAPFITGLANNCGTAWSGIQGSAPKNNWHDADYKVDGNYEATYPSKPNYATLTSGVSPSVHGLKDDNFYTQTNADNIYNQLRSAGKEAKDYYGGDYTPEPCNTAAGEFNGFYHDAIRYYINLGLSYCNSHDVPLSTFMDDVNNGTLPAFSFIVPSSDYNMHDNDIPSGDLWVKNFLTPFLDSNVYKSGQAALFFLWDEDTPIPNVLAAPSVIAGSKVPEPSGNPISHFSALRTWQEMLGLPYLGDSSKAPSLLPFFNGVQSNFSFGNTNVGASSGGGSFSSNSKRVNSLLAPDNGTLKSVSLFAGGNTSTSGSQKIKGVVYADNAGSPGKLLASSTNEITINSTDSPRWYSLSMPSVNITSGSRYWVGFLAGNGTSNTSYNVNVYYDLSTGSRVKNVNSYPTASDPFGSFSRDDQKMSIYATATRQTASTFSFGKTSVGSIGADGSGSFSNGSKRVNLLTSTASGTLKNVSLYAGGSGSTAGSQKIKAIIYADNAGSPGKWLATSSNEITISNTAAPNWYAFDMPAIVLSNGTKYWVGFMSSTGSGGYNVSVYYDNITNSRAKNMNPSYPTASDPFGSSSRDNQQMSVYVTGLSQ